MEAEDFVQNGHFQYIPRMEKEIFSFTAFVKEVDWTEPWLFILFLFHLMVTVVTLYTRHHGNFQAAFFFVLLMLVFGSANLNELAARYWMYFSKQQYFDSNGMFISIMFSSPILLNCLVMVGHWLWTSGNLMVKVKQAQLKAQLKAERRKHRISMNGENHIKDE